MFGVLLLLLWCCGVVVVDRRSEEDVRSEQQRERIWRARFSSSCVSISLQRAATSLQIAIRTANAALACASSKRVTRKSFHLEFLFGVAFWRPKSQLASSFRAVSYSRRRITQRNVAQEPCEPTLHTLAAAKHGHRPTTTTEAKLKRDSFGNSANNCTFARTKRETLCSKTVLLSERRTMQCILPKLAASNATQCELNYVRTTRLRRAQQASDATSVASAHSAHFARVRQTTKCAALLKRRQQQHNEDKHQYITKLR